MVWGDMVVHAYGEKRAFAMGQIRGHGWMLDIRYEM